MRATCISNDPKQVADHQPGRAPESEYPLTVGNTYVVLGMLIWENVFSFLVRDDWGGPCFAPAGFFALFTAPIPKGWMFGLGAGIRASGRELWSSPGVAVWGYPELVSDPGHVAALGDLKRAALDIFQRYWAAAEDGVKRSCILDSGLLMEDLPAAWTTQDSLATACPSVAA